MAAITRFTGKCKKCGLCCIIEIDTRQWRYCKYLDTKTNLCTVYNDRIGKDLGYGYTCVRRKDLHFNIPGCPYNKKRYKPHPAYY